MTPFGFAWSTFVGHSTGQCPAEWFGFEMRMIEVRNCTGKVRDGLDCLRLEAEFCWN